jgi:hypothetical protein
VTDPKVAKKPFTVQLSEDDLAKLKRRADALETSASSVARILIQYGLQRGRAGDAAKAALDAVEESEEVNQAAR